MPPAAPHVFILGNNPGKLQIRVSGTSQVLDAWIDRENCAWVTIPVPSPLQIGQQGDRLIVPLDGITQVVVPAPNPRLNQKQLKNVGFRLLESLSLTSSVLASGVMFVSRKNGVVAIDPIVWVRNIETLFYETACASGTAAVAITEALNEKKSLQRFPIIQPSGKQMFASIVLQNGFPIHAEIGGPITVVKRNIKISIPIKGGV